MRLFIICSCHFGLTVFSPCPEFIYVREKPLERILNIVFTISFYPAGIRTQRWRPDTHLHILQLWGKSSFSPKRLMYIAMPRLPSTPHEGITLKFITTPSQSFTRPPADALIVSGVLAFTSLRCTTTQRLTADGVSPRGTPPGSNARLGRLLGSR